MRKCALVAGLLAMSSAGFAFADGGTPSQAKLGALGLGSMQVATDEQGLEVRGKAFGTLSDHRRHAADICHHQRPHRHPAGVSV